MQMRRPIRSGQPLRAADIAKPDLVQRDDNVTLIFESAGLYLTSRGKALDSGTEGDTVSVLNLQSKRTISGVVVGRDQVAISVAMPRQAPMADTSAPTTVGSAETAPVAVAASTHSPSALKVE
jgi:flagella basal body P-ring formation protein FlgA